MQTFLPLPDIYSSLLCLDSKRLNKQITESYQIINTIDRIKNNDIFDYDEFKGKWYLIAWIHHPAVLMWIHNQECLKYYYNCAREIHISRGGNYKNSSYEYDINFEYPEWFGLDKFHKTHRSNLLRKNIAFYSQYKWKEDTLIPYFWPYQFRNGNVVRNF